MPKAETIFPYFRDAVEYPVPKPVAAQHIGKNVRYFAVKEAVTVDEQNVWNGQEGVVEGVGLCRVLATGRLMHTAPWYEGERIGITVEVLDEFT